ncbi:ribosome assembly factor SBDS [Candidatus Pacearchaeota archaeon CG_4_9_14_3_um_filter_31_7]|nr:MAG: rRNA metabolism protein [Candidatus Pacearchaeota archaeon CG1_02_31_27]PIN92573.1 MAG: ribosome assembly factor SBDS [Candidatus Pacearchaeota archaeon CG10_big_fil_rev_8_21_14_0_10_31_59]PIZ80743.1 MAG: ribosome assembly factor SBDS [Candidatus Pacearchaeota archaeon CG_4_10_14_0_2_um_filter_31_10]PJA70695.1 MAG: ribosome assembly factor SBDS [Candidatus Pacearchaeota archaeon CG_4_9_14_3_um_filter_31_7]
MDNVICKLRVGSKIFEILVDPEKALYYKQTKQGTISNIIAMDVIFLDSKKGIKASNDDIMKAFQTLDISIIAQKMIMHGEIEVPKKLRDKEHEEKIKQVVDFLSRNAIDPRTNRPHPITRIQAALEQTHINIKNKSVEEQINDILKELEKIIPIRIEVKKIKVSIPAVYTGKAYGILKDFNIQNEKWNEDGSLDCIVNIPAGLIMDFFDKLNGITHGAAMTEEMK